MKPISLPRRDQTIMHIAAGAGAPEVLEYLFSHRRAAGREEREGETPLDLADHRNDTAKRGRARPPRTSRTAR